MLRNAWVCPNEIWRFIQSFNEPVIIRVISLGDFGLLDCAAFDSMRAPA